MNKRAFSVIYMFLITLVFTSLVTVVKVFNEEKIEINQQVKLQKVILKVLDIPLDRNVSDEEIVGLFDDRVRQTDIKEYTLYTVYDAAGKQPTAHAVVLSGQGFWGPISVVVGMDADASKITGIEFFRHQETPGLGARITEPWFEKQFAGLPLAFGPEEKTFFSITLPAPNKPPRELDAITGATNTSRAVDVFLNRELARFLKEFRQDKVKR